MDITPHTVILVADDNEDDLFFLRRSLRLAGVREEPICFRDGTTLVEYIQHNCVSPVNHIVFIDFRMPKMDGAEVITWIRNNPRLADLNVVLLTGSADTADIARIMELGVQDYLIKPPTPEALSRLFTKQKRSVGNGATDTSAVRSEGRAPAEGRQAETAA